ncbi:bifunctional diguanylate cyclase/phosphodiesterase [Spiribacter sp. SSL99]|uniref:putative bifunctional diguanylate cyclase/phosphodiesterase n=1 Tax=Spiribacter sp. SSL99 TaxID=1866884 RepID=UPI001330ED4D|nr:EAL domain-containing protein [Spiribacter sp. SSL99]
MIVPALPAAVLGLVTFAAVALIYHHHLRDRLHSDNKRSIALGAMLGAGTVLLMVQPVEIRPGVLIDARVLLMGFAGLLGGWRGAGAALVVTLPARIMLGGTGMVVGMATLTLAALVGLIWRVIESRIDLRPPWNYFGFGAFLSLALVTILLFPAEARADALATVPALVGVNLVGAALARWMEVGVGQSIQQKERLERLSMTDTLTGVGSRLSLTEAVEARLANAQQSGQSFALISMDIDNLKNINGTLGYAAGDAVLRSLARRLSSATRPSEVMARVAGDEFVIVLPPAGRADVMSRADELLKAAREPHGIDSYVVLTTVSAGVVWAPGDGVTPRELIQNAEIAVESAKHQGRNQAISFDTQMREIFSRRAGLTQALHRELATPTGLSLAYQPQCRLSDGRLWGAEVLLRWDHPEFGRISPGEFVPVAEAAGLVRKLDGWVFDRAAAQLADWQRQGYDLKLSVNLSVLSLMMEGTAREFLDRLAAHDADPSMMTVEITESEALEDSETGLENLQILDAAGISLALDDFGTGHSSLRYVQNLPLSTLKIDKSFIGAIDGDAAKARAILRATLELARQLDLTVVAEGVETQSQFDWLRDRRCQVAQGFLLARPMTASDFQTDWLEQRLEAT